MPKILGYACINTTLRKDNIFSGRTCRINTAVKDPDIIKRISEQNLIDLNKILQWNNDNEIRAFRISSSVLPFCDHPGLGFKVKDLSMEDLFGECKKTGQPQFLSCHPGQYTVLLSDSACTRKKAVLTMDYHFDMMSRLTDNPDFPINLHIGFKKRDTTELFRRMDSYKDKPWFKNLTLENDDKESCWSIEDLLPFHKQFGIRLVFDIHHYKVGAKGSLSESESYFAARETWKDSRFPQKIHISESAPGKNPRKHSDFIENPLPDYILDDTICIVEAKQKELAVRRITSDANWNTQ